MAEAERKPSEPRFRDRFAYRTWVATRSNATGKGPARLSDVWNPPRPLSALLRTSAAPSSALGPGSESGKRLLAETRRKQERAAEILDGIAKRPADYHAQRVAALVNDDSLATSLSARDALLKRAVSRGSGVAVIASGNPNKKRSDQRVYSALDDLDKQAVRVSALELTIESGRHIDSERRAS